MNGMLGVLVLVVFIVFLEIHVEGSGPGVSMNPGVKRYVHACPLDCSGHGVCNNTVCACDKTYGGVNCSLVCSLACNISTSYCVDTQNYVSSPSSPPSWACRCLDGYSAISATDCGDIDECASSNDCSPYATCTNTIPGYSCSCNPPYIGDGKTCTLSPSSSPATLNTASLQILPSLLCWTRDSTAGWNFFLDYQSLKSSDYDVPVSRENILSSPATRSSLNPVAGQITHFIPGRHLAFKVNSQILSSQSVGVYWRLDGNTLSLSNSQSTWSTYSCPSVISFCIPVKVSCPTSSLLEQTITQNLIALLNQQKTKLGTNQQGELVKAILPKGICENNATGFSYATIEISVTTAPSVVSSPGSGATAMDLLFDTLLDNSVLSVLDGTGCSVVPKILADLVVFNPSIFNKLSSIPDPSLVVPVPSVSQVTVFSSSLGIYTISLSATCVLLALVFIMISISCIFWGKIKKNKMMAEQF